MLRQARAETTEHVVTLAAERPDAQRVEVGNERIIGLVAGGSDHEGRLGQRPRHGVDHVRDDRTASQGRQHFPGKAP